MKKRLYVVVLIVALIFGMLTVTVNAADPDFKVNLNASSTTVSKGNEVTVKLNISDFEDNVDKGINLVSGTMSVDNDVFENLTSDSIKGLNDWKVSFDESTGELECTKLKAITKSQDICEITLAVKSDTTSTAGEIELSNLTASDSDEKLNANDSSVEISIGTARTSGNTSRTANTSSRISNKTNTDTENTNTENEVNTNTNSTRVIRSTTNTNTNTDDESTNSSTNNSTDNSSRGINANTNNSNVENKSTDDEMPNTGLDDSIVKAIILVALFGLFGYIKVKSLDRK